MPSGLRRVVRSVPATIGHALLAGALAVAAAGAEATPYEFVYTGTFNTSESLTLAGSSTRNFFTSATAFTIRTVFDDSTINLVPPAFPFLGFAAYIPSLATIEIAGTTYNIATAATNATAGVTVAIFDRSQIFNAGRYGVGLIANVLSDGAGIVGDFLTASPDFTVNALTPTTFTDYQGVGHSSGQCITGSPPGCPKLDAPWVLRDANNVAFDLLLGNYEEDYPALHPGSGSTVVGPLNTAAITAAPRAVPEPATLGLVLVGLAGIVALGRGTRRSA